MSQRIRTIVRNPITGNGIAGITVSLKRHSDDGTITTADTDANGLAEFDLADVGYVGPAYLEYTSGDVYRRSGYIGGQIGGLIWSDTLNDIFTANGIGVVPGYLNGLAVSASGANMSVSIASGMAVLKDGIVYLWEEPQSVTMDTADGTHPRIDRIVLRLVREGQAQEGKVTLEKITGSPAASPSAPGITQSSTTWDLSLAQVRVNAGVSAVAADKVTDERYSTALTQAYSFAYPTGITAGDTFYIDTNGRLARLPKGTSGQVLTQGADIPAWNTGVSVGGITVNVGNSVDVILSSEPVIYVEFPFACDLTGWMVQGDVSGTIAFAVAKASSGSSSFSNIHGSNHPRLSAAQTASSTDMSSWTASITANQKLRISVTGTTTSIKRASCSLRFTRT